MPHLGSRGDQQQWPPEERGPRRPNANRGATKQAEGHKKQKRRRDSKGDPPPDARTIAQQELHTLRTNDRCQKLLGTSPKPHRKQQRARLGAAQRT